MRRILGAQAARLSLAVAVSFVVIIASATTVAGKRPPKPPPSPAPTTAPTNPPSGSVVIAIAAAGTLEPSRQYVNADVTVTCPSGWTWVRGGLNIRQADPGGSGSFSATCTGSPQVVRVRVVNGNKWTLGNATAQAFVTIARNGQEVQGSRQSAIRLEPLVTARIADQGQLTGATGSGVSIAVAVACPSGAIGVLSGISVAQGGTALASGSFTPVCDGTTRTFVIAMPASSGTFHTGAATSEAFATTEWNGQGFYGIDSRAITLLESSTGDTTPPSTPANLWANVFGDGETWLSWSASSDNATPSGLIVYEVYLNGRFDQPIGGGYTEAILYADLGVVSTIEVIAVDGAGNRSAAAIVTVDCSQGWCQ